MTGGQPGPIEGPADEFDVGGDVDVERVREAIRELRSIRSYDPCAAQALTTIKATIHTLETRWLPARGTSDAPPTA